MKKTSRKEAQEKIDELFREGRKLTPSEVKKIKRLVMKHNIKLGKNRKRFCKKCYSDLRNGKIKIKKGFKIVECHSCGFENKWKIKSDI